MRKDRMRARKILVWNSIVLAFLVILLGWLTTPHLQAQCTVATCEGWNGVYGSGSAKVPAYAFVDALPYMGDSRCLGSVCDLCDAIYYILFDYSPSKSGVVIDARGVATPQNCVSFPTHGAHSLRWYLMPTWSCFPLEPSICKKPGYCLPTHGLSAKVLL